MGAAERRSSLEAWAAPATPAMARTMAGINRYLRMRLLLVLARDGLSRWRRHWHNRADGRLLIDVRELSAGRD
ncbi:MAG: hypothetical protein BroJett030_31690 [Alphaproteobacteria bacterium]|nr:MAG: hypothetical protein BroJett030_31690 [Alphaproteobacteria bacterium]